MKNTFVMRGRTASGLTEVLNFGGHKPGYAYRLTEFQIYPGEAISTAGHEMQASLTAAKTSEDPSNPNFNNEGLIGTVYSVLRSDAHGDGQHSVINDTFLITQDLILAVVDIYSGSPIKINWQCRFEAVKMSGPEEATANFKQFTIFDD